MMVRSKEDIQLSVDRWDRGHIPLSIQDRVDVVHAIWSMQSGLNIGDPVFQREFDNIVHRLVSLWYMGRHHEKLRGGERIFRRD